MVGRERIGGSAPVDRLKYGRFDLEKAAIVQKPSNRANDATEAALGASGRRKAFHPPPSSPTRDGEGDRQLKLPVGVGRVAVAVRGGDDFHEVVGIGRVQPATRLPAVVDAIAVPVRVGGTRGQPWPAVPGGDLVPCSAPAGGGRPVARRGHRLGGRPAGPRLGGRRCRCRHDRNPPRPPHRPLGWPAVAATGGIRVAGGGVDGPARVEGPSGNIAAAAALPRRHVQITQRRAAQAQRRAAAAPSPRPHCARTAPPCANVLVQLPHNRCRGQRIRSSTAAT